MIFEFSIQSAELTITPNSDGTHAVRVVQFGRMSLEFTCDLERLLRVHVELDDDDSLRQVNRAGQTVVHQRVIDLDLHVSGRIRPDADGNEWVARVLERDDCGNDIVLEERTEE